MRTALLVFVASRAFFAVVAMAAVTLARPTALAGSEGSEPSGPARLLEALTAWDGRWYESVVTRGYGEAGQNPGTGQSTSAFFPLLPALMRLGGVVGLSPARAGVVASNLALVAALFAAHRLFHAWGGEQAARASLWVMGFAPFSAVFSMVYPEGLLALAAVGAFLSFEGRKPLLTAVFASAALLARPNGFAVPLVLGIWTVLSVVRSSERLRETVTWSPVWALPLVSFGAWMVLLGHWTGDPLAFVSAKRAWTEVTLFSLLGGEGPGAHLSGGTALHVALAAAAAAVVVAARRELPGSWTTFWLVYVTPSVLFGLASAGRYAWTAFPVFAATARLAQRARWAKPLVFGLGAAGTLVTVGIFEMRLVP